MKKISLWLLSLVFAVSFAGAQETAAQQQIDKLSGQIQDLTEGQARLGQRLEGIEKEIADLREKVNTPVVNDYATRAELKSLVEQMREIDRSRKEDTENIARQIDNLAKAAAAVPSAPTTHTHSTPRVDPGDAVPAPAPATPSKGYEYLIQQGDNLGLIIKAYKEKGVKVSKRQIIAANPGINPDILIPGKKLFIPDPSAK
jgi:TolA-binding protein